MNDLKGYDPFDIGAMGEFDVDVLVEQYAGQEEAKAIYPAWRGGYYFAGKPKADQSAPIAVVYISRWSTPAKAAEFAAVYAKSLAKRYKKRQPLGTDGKVAEDAPPADSWRTLRGRHAWLTEEGPVVIEVRGDDHADQRKSGRRDIEKSRVRFLARREVRARQPVNLPLV